MIKNFPHNFSVQHTDTIDTILKRRKHNMYIVHCTTKTYALQIYTIKLIINNFMKQKNQPSVT